jgi:hypothetical protein
MNYLRRFLTVFDRAPSSQTWTFTDPELIGGATVYSICFDARTPRMWHKCAECG